MIRLLIMFLEALVVAISLILILAIILDPSVVESIKTYLILIILVILLLKQGEDE